MVTKKEFVDEYKSGTLIKVMATKYGVSDRTIIEYAKKLGLSRGRGNHTKNRRAFNF